MRTNEQQLNTTLVHSNHARQSYVTSSPDATIYVLVEVARNSKIVTVKDSFKQSIIQIQKQKVYKFLKKNAENFRI